ncbi:hypothetical protein D7W79_01700 [Corallococcus exercitus]|uniref:hypothetical protein n=1 Tax=Corallococcus exercitus TaxID=2316736 RepID=UPI000EA03F31|nr:hypothetical protein [Corallococcus exercitus]RKG82742.1 hypothetical protein D7W79_01700 [Corallococcus exercitus]
MAKRGPSKKGLRLFGAPEPEDFRKTPIGSALAESAKIHFEKKVDQDRLLAVEKVALDIFYDPLAARAFAVNPEEYLRSAGFANVKLDLSSAQVRTAMALGDPKVRHAARNGDVEKFLDALMEQGIQPTPSMMPAFAFELAAVLSAVAVTWAAVGFSVGAGMWVGAYAAVAVKTAVRVSAISVSPETGGRSILGVKEHQELISRIAHHVGGPTFARQVLTSSTERIIGEYVKLHRRTLGLPEEP